jgi:DNA-binding NtrC family response regulator
MNDKTHIVVIDDQLGISGSMHQKAFLRAYGGLPYEFVFESCDAGRGYDGTIALECVRNHPETDLILLDIRFGEEGNQLGFEVLPRLTAQFPSVPVLIMSSVDRDVEALGRCLEDGAVGFMGKLQKPDTFQQVIEQALSMSRSHVLLGQSPALRNLRRQVARLSPYDQIPVLVIGERGTGKERVARYIHHNGPRSNGPFIPVNCAALPETLIDTELFGAEKGAYTGAVSTRIGYLERAHGGVLFLDEIGNMPVATQAKLLRALQEKAFRRIGVTEKEIRADFQVVCATNVEPELLVGQGRLRLDFLDRVAAVTLHTPSLRECSSDIPELVRHFLRLLGVGGAKKFSVNAIRILQRQTWPGNVRELQRVVQESVVLSEDEALIDTRHLPEQLRVAQVDGKIDVAPQAYEELVGEDPKEWPRQRLLGELRLAVEAKRRIQRYKGKQWKAEFMRLMYPECKAQNAKGFSDLINRLTKGPWGSRSIRNDPEMAGILEELVK